MSVLVYVGVWDLLCNWVGNLDMVGGLEWGGKEGFGRCEMEEWGGDGGDGDGDGDGEEKEKEKSNEGEEREDEKKKAGFKKSYGGLTFLGIEGAGHMVHRSHYLLL